MNHDASDTNERTGWQRSAAPEDGGSRLDRFWARELESEGVSRGKVKEWILGGLALVDGNIVTKPNFTVPPGASLSLEAHVPACRTGAETGELAVLHEEKRLLVLDKPAGLTTHPAPGEPEGTLVNRLLAHYPDISSERSGMDPVRPGIVHRLDKDTSGLMIVARDEATRLRLAGDFAARRVGKLYLALVHGVPSPRSGIINLPIGRDPRNKTRMSVAEKGGREARSSYTVLWTAPGNVAALVAVRIHTGRTHQVRVHMAAQGHPLLGDTVYGPREAAEWQAAGKPEAARQMLHACALRFVHPVSGELLHFRSDPPADFQALLEALAECGLRVGLVGPPGCGKSTLLARLAEQGLPIFSADSEVADLYAAGGDGADMIGRRFGNQYLTSQGAVDKPALFQAMRDSGQVLREVMDLVHPMVRHRAEVFFSNHAGEIAVAEVPLLLEGGWREAGMVDCVAGVFCPDELRRGAYRTSRGLDQDTLAVFDSWQWPADRKRPMCDFVVENDAGLDKLDAAAQALIRDLEALRAKRVAARLAEAHAAVDRAVSELENEEQ